MTEESKAGARHSGSDAKMIQTMHDHSVSLGASCGMEGKAANVVWACLNGHQHATPEEARACIDYHVNGNALKAVGKTDTELRVANYMVLFGGRDLEGIATKRRNQDGSRGEYFSKATKFDSSYTDVGTLYVDWEHGMYGGNGEPGADDVLGYVDWKSAKVDDKGLFVERVLNRRNKYVLYLEELIGDGLIGNSSQAVASDVQKAANGEITKWPLLRDTLTVAPMEPRMLTANSLAALKALSAGNPALKSIVEQAELFSTPEATPKAASKTAAIAERDALLLELDLLALEMTP
jgi:hypothetical protein